MRSKTQQVSKGQGQDVPRLWEVSIARILWF